MPGASCFHRDEHEGVCRLPPWDPCERRTLSCYDILLHRRIFNRVAARRDFRSNSASFDVPVAELAGAAEKAGFQGLELWARDVVDPAAGLEIAETLSGKGLRLSAFQLVRDYEGMGDGPRGDRLAEAERLMGMHGGDWR